MDILGNSKFGETGTGGPDTGWGPKWVGSQMNWDRLPVFKEERSMLSSLQKGPLHLRGFPK